MEVEESRIQHIPRILSLDGGGVRGLSSLLILQRLMQEIQRIKGESQPPLPCQYFDLICGTSTGGLIAIMLGRLRMPVDVCIEKYMTLSKKVFRVDNVIKDVPVGPDHCRFNEEPLEKALKEIISQSTGDENAPMAYPNDRGHDLCPTFVVATEGQDTGGPVKLFRSYGFYKDQCPIWQAGRATSAAPSYFTPAWVDVPNPGGWYIDGGLRRNNPSEVALSEARKYWKTVRRFCIVSIGTGEQKTVDFIEESAHTESQDSDHGEEDNPDSASPRPPKRFKSGVGRAISSVLVNIGATVSETPLAKTAVHVYRVPGGIATLKRFGQELVKLSTESEDTHRRMWELANAHEESLRFPYYRFNVGAGMKEIGLEEWKKITKMGALTRGYLVTPSIETSMEKCAKALSDPASIERIPQACFMVPYERNEHFAGRKEFLKQLLDRFNNSTPRPYQRRIALFGMGGVGKTQTALEYVYTNRASYNRIYWITAVDQVSLLSGYQKIAKTMGLKNLSQLSPVETVQTVLSWLSQEQSWLLVLDNLDDINVVSSKSLDAVNVEGKFLPPTGPHQHTLITTRNPHAVGIPAEGMEVPLLNLEESVNLLSTLSNIGITPNSLQREQADQIVNQLGYLPLGIEQAAAYVREVTGDFMTFLQHYDESRRDLHRWVPQGIRPYPHSVATTWSMSFNIVRNNHRQAAELFQLLSFLNPDGILIDFLQAEAEALRDDLRQLVSNQHDMSKALIELERFSLLKWNRLTKTLLVHRLMQAVVKDEMSEANSLMLRTAIINLCDRSFPHEWTNENRKICRNYIGQVMEPLLGLEGIRTEKLASVMYLVGSFLREDGKINDSERLSLQAFRINTEILGDEHPATLTTMGNLALTYRAQGKTAEAAALHERVLEATKRILGDDHPSTLTTMNNLAGTYWVQGTTAEAATLQEQVLEKRKRILGDDHPSTLTTMNDLALTYGDQGKTAEAATLEEQVLEKRKRILGDDHPDTLTAMGNLPETYRDQHRAAEAAALEKQVLEKRRSPHAVDFEQP